MRFLIDEASYQEMCHRSDHSIDCYVRPGQYLHHLYRDGVKFVVAPALKECIEQAEAARDVEAILHLNLHQDHLQTVLKEAQRKGNLDDVEFVGDPLPEDGDTPTRKNDFLPREPKSVEETGLSTSFFFDLILRTIYNRGRVTGADLANELRVPLPILSNILNVMRKQTLIDIAGQRPGMGDAGLEYDIKPPRGTTAIEDALKKTEYFGPAPVPFTDYVESVLGQTVKNVIVTRQNIQQAFADLIITDAVFSEIGPAVNSASSIFLFGFPGNGKTVVAERITRLMGDDIFIPYAIEIGGTIIKLFDPVLHEPSEEEESGGSSGLSFLKSSSWDHRYVKIHRPTIVTGGELTMAMLDLKYNPVGRFYEAPVHMKANGGIFMIDDFGRQLIRPMDLLNRWIVPLEKRYDYMTTVTGNKIEVPFDQILIFSTNLDPMQLADEAFLRRIKFKIEIRDPEEHQWRLCWKLMCKSRRVEYDDRAIDYLVEKWYKPVKRPFRMCQPRDILDQIASIAKYNMETPCLSPDLIDAGCATYFVSSEKKEFGAKIKVD